MGKFGCHIHPSFISLTLPSRDWYHSFRLLSELQLLTSDQPGWLHPSLSSLCSIVILVWDILTRVDLVFLGGF